MRTTESINKTGAGSLRFLYNTAVGRFFLRLLICKPISNIVGFFLDRKISSLFIKGFIKSNGIDMSDYEQREFNSFNDFFTRELIDGARPVADGEDDFVSPADARLSVYPITPERYFTVKGVDYTIADLLENPKLADRFNGGYCMIFRLAVDNYHRYGWCADGQAEKTVHIKGKYHTVQPIAMRRYPVFRENVREYTVLNTEKFGTVVQVEGGALMVGRICNNELNGCRALKGAEKGMFQFGGSTVIILVEKGKIQLDEEFIHNTENELETNVKYGEKIAVNISYNGITR